jgi:hypothetical protein
MFQEEMSFNVFLEEGGWLDIGPDGGFTSVP